MCENEGIYTKKDGFFFLESRDFSFCNERKEEKAPSLSRRYFEEEIRAGEEKEEMMCFLREQMKYFAAENLYTNDVIKKNYSYIYFTKT